MVVGFVFVGFPSVGCAERASGEERRAVGVGHEWRWAALPEAACDSRFDALSDSVWGPIRGGTRGTQEIRATNRLCTRRHFFCRGALNPFLVLTLIVGAANSGVITPRRVASVHCQVKAMTTACPELRK